MICCGTLTAAIVDTPSLESYKYVKPGCYAHLKIVQVSEAFPRGHRL